MTYMQRRAHVSNDARDKLLFATLRSMPIEVHCCQYHLATGPRGVRVFKRLATRHMWQQPEVSQHNLADVLRQRDLRQLPRRETIGTSGVQHGEEQALIWSHAVHPLRVVRRVPQCCAVLRHRCQNHLPIKPQRNVGVVQCVAVLRYCCQHHLPIGAQLE
jgi:hypothetical protein